MPSVGGGVLPEPPVASPPAPPSRRPGRAAVLPCREPPPSPSRRTGHGRGGAEAVLGADRRRTVSAGPVAGAPIRRRARAAGADRRRTAAAAARRRCAVGAASCARVVERDLVDDAGGAALGGIAGLGRRGGGHREGDREHGESHGMSSRRASRDNVGISAVADEISPRSAARHGPTGAPGPAPRAAVAVAPVAVALVLLSIAVLSNGAFALRQWGPIAFFGLVTLAFARREPAARSRAGDGDRDVGLRAVVAAQRHLGRRARPRRRGRGAQPALRGAREPPARDAARSRARRCGWRGR